MCFELLRLRCKNGIAHDIDLELLACLDLFLWFSTFVCHFVHNNVNDFETEFDTDTDTDTLTH